MRCCCASIADCMTSRNTWGWLSKWSMSCLLRTCSRLPVIRDATAAAEAWSCNCIAGTCGKPLSLKCCTQTHGNTRHTHTEWTHISRIHFKRNFKDLCVMMDASTLMIPYETQINVKSPSSSRQIQRGKFHDTLQNVNVHIPSNRAGRVRDGDFGLGGIENWSFARLEP